MNICDLALPGAHFASASALKKYRPQAAEYERAVAAYAADNDDVALENALTALGCDEDEIQEHIDKPGYRMPQGYI